MGPRVPAPIGPSERRLADLRGPLDGHHSIAVYHGNDPISPRLFYPASVRMFGVTESGVARSDGATRQPKGEHGQG